MWLERLSNRNYLALANALLITVLLLLSMLLVRDIIMLVMWEGKGQAGVSEKTAGRVERHPLEYYAELLENNIFGFPPGTLSPIAESVEVEEQVAPLKESSNVKLLGAVSWKGGFGYAVLSVDDAAQEIYRRGDIVPGAGSLKHVGTDRVIIESGGETMELRLPDLVKTVSSPAEKSQSSRNAAPKQNTFARKTSENTYVVDQKGVEASLANPKRMLTDARLLPNLVNGKQNGFVIREIKPNGLYAALGLQNGDILLRVNEFDISSAETGLQAFTALQGMDKIDLDILRNGSKMNLTYIIR